MAQMRFSCIDSSIDVQHDIFGSTRDPELRSNFGVDPLRTFTHFDTCRLEEHDAAKIISLAVFVQKWFAKKNIFLAKNDILTFLDFYSLVS